MEHISVFVRTDLLIFSIVLNIILLIYTKIQYFKEDYSSKLYRRVLIAITTVTIFELISWCTGEIGNDAQIPIHYWSNALFLSLLSLPAALGISYLDFKIFGNEELSKKRLFIYLIPTYVSISFAIYNFFDEGFFFYIDKTNQYYRGIGVSLALGVMYLVFIITLACFYRNKRLITGRMVQVIMIFFVIPIIGSAMQTLAYGTTYGMSSYTLSAFITFLLMEKDKMAKDVLTNLYTRTNLESRLRFKIKAKEPFTVIMADLNGFKEINDNYGHIEGDRVLQKVAEILRLNTNVEDMVCRYGGDEFLILIECDEDIGNQIICRIDRALIRYNLLISNYKVQLSYGHVFVSDPEGVVMEEILHKADQNMYQDKAIRKEEISYN